MKSMLIIEYKVKPNKTQIEAIEQAIRTVQFVRNKSIALWESGQGINKNSMSIICAALAKEFDFANKLNSQARQAASERAWTAVSKFYKNCKTNKPGKKGYPKYQKNNRSVEYKTTGWKLSEDCKRISFTDKHEIGSLKLIGSQCLNEYKHLIKRVRIIRKADSYYVQFCVNADRNEMLPKTGSLIGLDLGLTHFLTDSNGVTVENPRFLRKSESKIKRRQRQISRKKKGSSNRKKAVKRLGKAHQKVSRQRKDFAVKIARAQCVSNDTIVIEDLKVSNMVKNHCLAKSISDASWYQFREWLTYFAKVFSRELIVVKPHYTSQECSECGVLVKKSLSQRTHVCKCGFVLDRDHNAALNILNKSTVGHTGINASGQNDLCTTAHE